MVVESRDLEGRIWTVLIMMYGLHLRASFRRDLLRRTNITGHHFFSFYLVDFCVHCKRDRKAGGKGKRVIGRALVVLFPAVVFQTRASSRFQDDGLPLAGPFSFMHEREHGTAWGPHYIHFLNTVLLPCINTLSMK